MPGAFGQSWARDLARALTLLFSFLDRVPDLKFGRIMSLLGQEMVWKNVEWEMEDCRMTNHWLKNHGLLFTEDR